MSTLAVLVGLAMLALVNAVAFVAARFATARGLDVGGVRFFARSIATKARGAKEATFARRAAVSAAGLAATYGIAVLVAFVALEAYGEAHEDTTSMRVVVARGGPADAAGMRDGDRITSVDGEAVGDWTALRRAVATHPAPLDVGFERDGAPKHLRITPDASGRIRVSPPTEHTALSTGAALARALAFPPSIVGATLANLGSIFFPRQADVVGPLGVVKEVEASPQPLMALASLDAYYLPFFALLAVLSFPRRQTS